MSTIRKRFLVSWGDGEPVEVQTNARDMTRAADYSNNTAMATFALLHSALTRQNKANVPKRLDDFLDLLDDVQPLNTDTEEESDEADPTSGVATDGEPSSLPAQLVSTGTSSSGNTTRAPSTRQKRS